MQSNIPESIFQRIHRNLHRQPNHPINIVKTSIIDWLCTQHKFEIFDSLSPRVTTRANFDDLLIPHDHVSRSKSDTYYFNDTEVLRTHTSAHQTELLSQGYRKFLVTGDVYRKDEIDATHFPVFHQMEGMFVYDKQMDEKDVLADLKKILSGLAKHLFPNSEIRFNTDYFPFTHPSLELEVWYNNRWLEVLGCGVVRNEILNGCGISTSAYAFGLGLERLAMVLFDIPDIRLFWSTDARFLTQFRDGEITKFVSYSKLQSIDKDISFFVPAHQVDVYNTWNNSNDFFDVVRSCDPENLIAQCKMYDTFYNQKLNKLSTTWRITITPTDKICNPAELTQIANNLITRICCACVQDLNVVIR